MHRETKDWRVGRQIRRKRGLLKAGETMFYLTKIYSINTHSLYFYSVIINPTNKFWSKRKLSYFPVSTEVYVLLNTFKFQRKYVVNRLFSLLLIIIFILLILFILCSLFFLNLQGSGSLPVLLQRRFPFFHDLQIFPRHMGLNSYRASKIRPMFLKTPFSPSYLHTPLLVNL